MNKLKMAAVMVVLVFVAAFGTGCSMMNEDIMGPLLGAAAGGIIGNQSGEAGLGALTGVVVGQTVGSHMRMNRIENEAAKANTRVVPVYSADGTFIEVVLKRHPNGWVVPQTGEVFSTEPTAEQLKNRGYGPR